ncbi:hypothetical protein BT69DRAFT_1092572 [Atractiella rhizophila]|nr:hypothetical protein BT69DRAFT_1092572 [Atractiella rhizophila]
MATVKSSLRATTKRMMMKFQTRLARLLEPPNFLTTPLSLQLATLHGVHPKVPQTTIEPSSRTSPPSLLSHLTSRSATSVSSSIPFASSSSLSHSTAASSLSHQRSASDVGSKKFVHDTAIARPSVHVLLEKEGKKKWFNGKRLLSITSRMSSNTPPKENGQPPVGRYRKAAMEREKEKDAGASRPLSPGGRIGNLLKLKRTPSEASRSHSSLGSTVDGDLRSPVGSMIGPPSAPRSPLPSDPESKTEMLQKLDHILASSEQDVTQKASILDNPPRKFLSHGPVMQVAGHSTAKQRHYFIFSDILVCCKPIKWSNEGESSGDALDKTFIVKNIFELDKIRILPNLESNVVDPLLNIDKAFLEAFVQDFNRDPRAAVTDLITRGGIEDSALALSKLLHALPRLNNAKLGSYLSDPALDPVLRSFIDQFAFTGVSLDDALRTFILKVSLPGGVTKIEYLLKVFVEEWLKANKSIAGCEKFTVDAVFRLIIATMRLNDALYYDPTKPTDSRGAAQGFFGFSSSSLSLQEFSNAFRVHDEGKTIPQDLITAIYRSIAEEPLQLPLTNPDDQRGGNAALLPRITLDETSEYMSISIPQPDPHFKIQLYGEGLEFYPSVLEFGRSGKQSFRIRGRAIGKKTVCILKLGSGAKFYGQIPSTVRIDVSRSFMEHTLLFGHASSDGITKKYLFSFRDLFSRNAFFQTLKGQIEERSLHNIGVETQAEDGIAMDVLRDALIPVSSANGSPEPPRINKTLSQQFCPPSDPSGIRTGHDLVMTCEQNSLLPLVLMFLNSGLPVS